VRSIGGISARHQSAAFVAQVIAHEFATTTATQMTDLYRRDATGAYRNAAGEELRIIGPVRPVQTVA
jgi:hypothetical protein